MSDEKYTHEVWTGVLTATRGEPQPGDKWVPCEIIPDMGGTDRQVYIVTERGNNKLFAWKWLVRPRKK
jgi:hypothetical protein